MRLFFLLLLLHLIFFFSFHFYTWNLCQIYVPFTPFFFIINSHLFQWPWIYTLLSFYGYFLNEYFSSSFPYELTDIILTMLFNLSSILFTNSTLTLGSMKTFSFYYIKYSLHFLVNKIDVLFWICIFISIQFTNDGHIQITKKNFFLGNKNVKTNRSIEPNARIIFIIVKLTLQVVTVAKQFFS